jgi:arginine/serine-rich splicing factor 7
MPRYSRSRSRSRSNPRNYRSRDSDRNGGHRRSDDHEDSRLTDTDMCRLHIGDLTDKVAKSDIEKSFSKFGEVEEVWMAKNPPCFAFVVFKTKDDAAEALKEMDGRTLGGSC